MKIETLYDSAGHKSASILFCSRLRVHYTSTTSTYYKCTLTEAGMPQQPKVHSTYQFFTRFASCQPITARLTIAAALSIYE